MPTLPDLVPLQQVYSDLAVALPSNKDAVPFLLKAASSQIRKYCERDFSQTDYTQFAYANTIDGRGFSEIQTRQYPVNSISRLSINPTTILSVTNNQNAVNQRATATVTVTGDVGAGLNVTGLTLYRMASGVATTDSTSILFATYPTATTAAAAITALGNGWKGIAAGGYANWATADIMPTTGAMGALSPGQADFQAYIQDVTGYDLDPGRGIIRLRNQTFDPVFALMNLDSTTQQSSFPLRWRGIQINYNAGFATIPEGVQMATMTTIKEWIYKLQINTSYQSETDVDWSVTLALPFLNVGLPQAAKEILQKWRSFRQI